MTNGKTNGDAENTKQSAESCFHAFRKNTLHELRKPRIYLEFLALVGLAFYSCETRRTNNLTQIGLDNANLGSANSAHLAQLSERAWLGTSKTELKFAHQPKPGEQVPFVGEFLEARVEFLNTGRTPALNVRIATDGFVAPIEFGPKGEQYIGVGLTKYQDSNYQFGGNIPPGGAIYREVRMWPQQLTQENVLDLQKPTHRAFIQGRGTYCDVVNPNVTHWFTFRFFLTLPGGEPAFAVYPVFNELGDESAPCH